VGSNSVVIPCGKTNWHGSSNLKGCATRFKILALLPDRDGSMDGAKEEINIHSAVLRLNAMAKQIFQLKFRQYILA
jgi:hypothetical protein